MLAFAGVSAATGVGSFVLQWVSVSIPAWLSTTASVASFLATSTACGLVVVAWRRTRRLRRELETAEGAYELLAEFQKVTSDDADGLRDELKAAKAAATDADQLRSEADGYKQQLDSSRAQFEQLRREAVHPAVVSVAILKGKRRGECRVRMRIRLRTSLLAVRPSDRVEITKCELLLPYPHGDIALPDPPNEWTEPVQHMQFGWDYDTEVRVGDARARILREFLEEQGNPQKLAVSVDGLVGIVPMNSRGERVPAAGFDVPLRTDFLIASIEWPLA